MASKTLEELRAMARTLGIKGCSRLRKHELIALLEKQKKKSAAARGGGKAPSRARKQRAPAPAAPPTEHPEPRARLMPRPERISSGEERVETAKFALAPPGVALGARALTDLREDIERLPALREPFLCLLPQKPGILLAYWVLAAPMAGRTDLKIRLCRIAGGTLDIVEEVPVSGDRGQWYFHVREDLAPGGFYVHLGYYETAGGFVTAIQRGIARLPNLYASDETDRQWRITEEQFRAMYLRAGGVARGGRLGWPGSTSSRR